MPQSQSKALYCFCHKHTKLAHYGVDEEGNLFVHVKVYKGETLYGEMVVTGVGSVIRLHCRFCFRWHRVYIRPDSNTLVLRADRELTDSFPYEQS